MSVDRGGTRSTPEGRRTGWGAARRTGTVPAARAGRAPEARAKRVAMGRGGDPAPRGAVSRVRGSWGRSSGPAVRLPRNPLGSARALEVRQVAQRLVESPAPGLRGHGLAVDVRDDLVRGQRLAAGEGRPGALQTLGDEGAVGVDVCANGGERAPVAGPAQPRGG